MPTDFVSVDQPCSSGAVQIISVSESVNTRRWSADSEESDFHAPAEYNDLFDIHCELRYVLSDSSDSDADRDSADESGETLSNSLREWAVQHQIPNPSLSDLLGILRKSHPNLPKDPRTLLKTKINYTILNKCGGDYYYFGIVSSIYQEIRQSLHLIPDQYTLKLQINIDGLPLFKSTSDQLWPILGKILNIKSNNKVFIICLFNGTKNQIILKNI